MYDWLFQNLRFSRVLLTVLHSRWSEKLRKQWNHQINDQITIFREKDRIKIANQDHMFPQEDFQDHDNRLYPFKKKFLINYSGGPLFCVPLFCTIFRFWNYKIRGTYYAFRIQIQKFSDSTYKVYLKFAKHKKWEHKFPIFIAY